MGGRSFKCPECAVWKINPGALRDHAKAKHNVELEFEGNGPFPKAKVPTAFKLEGLDLAAIEVRALAYFTAGAKGEKVGERHGPADPVERARWKARNYFAHYGRTGRMKDSMK